MSARPLPRAGAVTTLERMSETRAERNERLRKLREEVLESIHARERSREPVVHLTRDELYDRDALRREAEDAR